MKLIISHYSKAAQREDKSENQDCYAILEIPSFSSNNKSCYHYFIISDGMGGLNSPVEASHTAVTAITSQFLEETTIDSDVLSDAIIKANEILLSKSVGRDLGATATILCLANNAFNFAHIGDCRIFMIRDDQVDILTEDHSKLAIKLGVPNPTRSEVKSNLRSKKLVKSLGEKHFDKNYLQSIEAAIPINVNDAFVICSDGFWTEIDIEEIAEVINTNPHNAAEILTNRAYQRDNTDDVTCITIKVG